MEGRPVAAAIGLACRVRCGLVVRISPALLLLILGGSASILGCSSSSKQARNPRDAELEAALARRKEIEDAKPKRPYETRERIAYRATDRCGQGPYRLEADSLRARYGEQIVVYACGRHDISGDYRLTVERKDRPASSSESAFGFGDRDNAACKANRAADAPAGGGTGAGGGSSKAGGTGAGGRPTAPPAKLKPTTLERVATVPEACRRRTQLLDSTYYASGDWIPLEARLVIDFWSDEPNDLEDLVFVIEKKAVVADMTVERWKAYLEADRAWSERYWAFVDGELAAGRSKLLDTKARTPPPPPPRAEVRPPRASKNARWIPGYWHYEGASFHWIAGLWEVPAEDIAKDLTVHAPKPPPPAPPVEQPKEPRPATAAVWAPGQWQWDGRAYVWVAGSWRIPPSQKHTWQPAGWSIQGRGAIFVPGGWRVRIGR
jgi:hypothetical protein